MVIAPPSGVRMLVATKPVDFRKGERAGGAGEGGDGRRSVLGRDLRLSGQAGGQAQAALLRWHGRSAGGQDARARRLSLAQIQDGAMRLSASQLSALLDGMDWARVYNARRTRVPIAAN